MCGIAGIIGRIDEANRRALDRMVQAMRHRGPDGAGSWASPVDAEGRGCLLAHRRLSILDLSEAADQPMIDPASGNVLVFNGEIYNFKELRSDLRAAGLQVRSSGDTEVLLRALSTRGPAALGDLRGMFAFGMWDATARELVLARDPLGIKPLYVAHNSDPNGDWSLLFASEVRAILASGLLGRPRLDPAAVASVLWNGFVMGPPTAVRGVEALRPGELRIVDARGRTRRSEFTWTIPRAEGPPADEASVREVLQESVREHLVSDVPLGVFLSGGIDSSAVANLAQRAADRPVTTLTLSFEEAAFDEGRIARRVAEAIGTRHVEVLLTEGRFVAELDRALDALDQPTFDGINTYFIARAAREAGLTVVLVGTGGDELFGGYRSFAELPALQRWARRTRRVPQAAKSATAALAAAWLAPRRGGAVAPQTRWAKLPELVRAGDDLIRLYQLAYALFLPGFQRELSALPEFAPAVGLPGALLGQLQDEIRGRTPLAAIGVLEQRCFLGERLLRDSDVAGMAASLEIRLPLVDQVVVEQANRLPDGARFRPVGRKELLRRAGLGGLDPGLFDRPKSGFVLPYDRWIRAGLGDAIDGLMRDESAAAAVGLDGPAVARLWEAFRGGAPGLYWSRVWALYVLLRWCHGNGVVL
jgi:asparagine synthase (glutamine-hydrolysing)